MLLYSWLYVFFRPVVVNIKNVEGTGLPTVTISQLVDNFLTHGHKTGRSDVRGEKTEYTHQRTYIPFSPRPF